MRFAICNEMFEGWPLGRVAEFAADLGYEGVEIAPFTLADDISRLTPADRRALRREVESHHIRVAGLHWLLAQPPGLHITSSDPGPRRRAVEHLHETARLCGQLGGRVMVLGSPAQRTLPPDTPIEEGRRRMVDVLRRVIPIADARGVVIGLEPLPPTDTDFINTADEAVGLIGTIRHPRLRLALDVRAMILGETDPPAKVIERTRRVLRHFHANDPNRLGPGMGEADQRPVAEALRGAGYDGWVSVEVFDTSPGAETIARESLRTLREFYAEPPGSAGS